MKVLGVVGDVNPIQYGGWVVLAEPCVDCLVIEPIDWEENGKLTYRVTLDRMKVVGDITTRKDCLVDYAWDNQWAGEIYSDRREWWDRREFREFIESSGIGWAEFVSTICHESPVQRAWAYREIAGYYGIRELDDSPRRESEASLRKRLALPLYHARKAKRCTVYA